jgi:hypothetical protein
VVSGSKTAPRRLESSSEIKLERTPGGGSRNEFEHMIGKATGRDLYLSTFADI